MRLQKERAAERGVDQVVVTNGVAVPAEQAQVAVAPQGSIAAAMQRNLERYLLSNGTASRAYASARYRRARDQNLSQQAAVPPRSSWWGWG